MGRACKWRSRWVLTVAVSSFALGGFPGPAAGADAPDPAALTGAADPPGAVAPAPAPAPAAPEPVAPAPRMTPSAPAETVAEMSAYEPASRGVRTATTRPAHHRPTSSAPSVRSGRAQTAIHGAHYEIPHAPGEPVRHLHFPHCTIRGGPRADTIHGTKGDDVICGGGGNDVIHGDGGNDSIRGGPGDDTVDGGPGNDDVRGEGGQDIVNGGAGDDIVDGDGPPVPFPNGREGFFTGPPLRRDSISCGDGEDRYSLDPRDVVAADCERFFVIERALSVTAGGTPGGGAAPVDAPASAAGSILGLRREIAEGMRHLVGVTVRDLVLRNGTIKLVLDCNAGSVGWPARARLVGGGQAKLANAKFKCVDLTPVTVELRPTRRLGRVLAKRDEIRARLVVRIHGRTERARVTIRPA